MSKFKFDKEEVKQAAADFGWERVLSDAGAPITEGTGKDHKGPCLACNGGNDRFFRKRDFKTTGAVHCRHCFTSKSGDGFAWIMHCKGIGFSESLSLVASIVGMKGQRSEKAPPVFKDSKWSDLLFSYWGLKKSGITREGIEKVGGVQSMHCGKRCLRIPVIGQTPHDASVFVSISGNWKFGEEDPISKKTISKCKNGFSGFIPDNCRVLIKCEGYTDLLAAMSLDLPDDVGVVTNTFGAGDTPKPKLIESMVSDVQEVWVVHDCDVPGQDGSKPFAGCFANFVPTKNLVLPFHIEEKNGKDLRDFIQDGNGFDELLEIADATEATEGVAVSPPQIIEKISDPHRLARINLENYWRDKGRKIIYWQGRWMVYREGCYVEIDHKRIASGVMAGIKAEFDRQWHIEYEEYLEKSDKEEGPPEVRVASISLQRNVIEATRSLVTTSINTQADTWLPTGERKSYISMKNGVLDLDAWLAGDADCLMEHSPDWFSLTKTEFAFDPDAKCENWEAFIRQVFTDENQISIDGASGSDEATDAADEQIDILQKFFGYCITYETYLQKILFIEGPTRSGKGTILKILNRIIGAGSVASPTFSTLCGQFGLEDLIGKRLAMITDARVSARADLSVGIERLLSISSADPVTVDIKGRSAITTELFARVLIATNEIPQLSDSSGAFANRMVCLQTPNSYLHREDFELLPRLTRELPGIFLWCLTGLKVLEADRSSFRQPASSQHLHDELAQETSPMKRFADECLVVLPKNSSEKTPLKQIHYCHCQWAKDRGHKTVKANTFSRQLTQVVPSAKSERLRPGGGGKKERFFFGVKLNETQSKLCNIAWQRADCSKIN